MCPLVKILYPFNKILDFILQSLVLVHGSTDTFLETLDFGNFPSLRDIRPSFGAKHKSPGTGFKPNQIL